MKISLIDVNCHIYIFLADGSVYVWGSNEEGYLGIGEDVESCGPTKLTLDSKIVHISCHFYHSALVTGS